MNTKEAIEFVEEHKVDYGGETGYEGRIIQYENNNIIKMYDEIISLLQQGEADNKELKITKEELKKYRQMWEELKKERINELKSKQNDVVALSGLTEMEILEQKHFPKKSSRNIKKVKNKC